MAFHSFPFILLFLPIGLALYFLLARRSERAAQAFLIAHSLIFYAWGGLQTLPILAGSILFNYWVSLRLGRDNPASAQWLRVALVADIAALGLFKYTALFPLLPLGISFFTVQQIMFLVDRHQGITARQSLLDYSLFVSWFPYIVAGPITRWKEVMPQFHEPGHAKPDPERLARGAILFTLGLAKKVIVADSFARWVDTGFRAPNELGWAGGWILAASYALQIYFDFSGYTDMARGAAAMFNVKLPENFNNPFRSLSIIEYWQRWHITLTNFITNYIYMPLLRRGRPTFRKAMVSTVVAMTIAGVWHGASWGYVVFGVWHGLGLVVNHIWRKYKLPMPTVLAWCLTAAFLLVAFVFFRSPALSVAFAVLRAMFLPGELAGNTLREMVASGNIPQFLGMLSGAALLLAPSTAPEIAAKSDLRPRFAMALAVCTMLAFIAMNSKVSVEFIYRQF